jgi:hypothetical protein
MRSVVSPGGNAVTVSAFNLRNPSTQRSLSILRRVAVSIDELCPTPAGGCIGYCNRCGFIILRWNRNLLS